ncbi:MAG: hypothetical protein HOV68_29415, partial [Streptomycetaceae bacterium]|nr:hypothetical protein [Streptomycetaceae bacterium]
TDAGPAKPRLVDQVGGYGLRTGSYPSRPAMTVRVLGYPANMDNGQIEQECIDDIVPSTFSQARVSCFFAGGSSGGPWVWHFTRIGYLVGVTSTGSTPPDFDWSPQFGSIVMDGYQETAND